MVAVPEFRLVVDEAGLSGWIEGLAGLAGPAGLGGTAASGDSTGLVFGVDTETTGLDPLKDRVRFLQVAAGGTTAGGGEDYPVLLVDLFAWQGDPATRARLLSELLGRASLRVLQNAKFDRKMLATLGVRLPGPVFDTMLAAQLLRTPAGPQRASLDELVHSYLGGTLSKKEQASDWSGPIREEQLVYAARDARTLLPLYRELRTHLDKAGLGRAADLEFACMGAVADMELAGIRLDLARWSALREETERARDEALARVYAYTGRPLMQISFFGEAVAFGPLLDSRNYLLDLLHANGVPVKDTSRHELYPYAAEPLVAAILDWRKAQKSLSAFLLSLPDAVHPVTGRLHPKYGQIGASSGRMSCSAPNIQQIPRDPAFRRCIVPDPGCVFLVGDYSQVELRVAAQFANDARMIEAYRNGEDLHRLTASLMSGKPAAQVTKEERQAAKAVNFGLVFAMGAHGLQSYAAEQYGVAMTLDEAEHFRNRFLSTYKGIAAWQKALRDHSPIESRTLSGRRIPLEPGAQLSLLCNLPVQGTAADIVKIALGRLSERFAGTRVRIVAAVHDEILLEAPEAEAEATAQQLKEVMEAAERSLLHKVPPAADVSVAHSWADKA